MKPTVRIKPTTDSSAMPSRRQFLKGTVALSGVLASGTLLATLAPSRTWALSTSHLDKTQAESLLAMAKRLYPHKTLPDAVYALLVKDVDEACSDQATRELVIDGISQLNAATQNNWLGASAAEQTAALKTMENEAFFQMVRGQCIHSLYDNQMAYTHFGYEGESWTKGGYIRRGFDDLSWLPNPPEAASPAVI